MDLKDIVDLEPAKMDIYGLLADCYRLPVLNLEMKLNHLNLKLKEVCFKASEYLQEIKEEINYREDFEELRIEYTKLFIGPFTLLAAPYGSVYLEEEHRIMGRSSQHAHDMYREAGLDVADDYHDAPDHIATELEFVHFLIFKEIFSMIHLKPEDALYYLKKRKAFLITHLGSWIFDFASSVEKNTEMAFYSNIAKATSSFIKMDLEHLSEFSLPDTTCGTLEISEKLMTNLL